jgi:hypothetical protein
VLEAPWSALKNPAAHEEHVASDVAPAVELHVPGGQGAQARAPLAKEAKVPAGQLGAGVWDGVGEVVGVAVAVTLGVEEKEGVLLVVGELLGVLLTESGATKSIEALTPRDRLLELTTLYLQCTWSVAAPPVHWRTEVGLQ